MQSRQTSLIKSLQAFLLISILLCYQCVCYAGSMDNYHNIINKTNENIIVTLFESYPVNKVHVRLLKPSESLVVKSSVERPSQFYMITITRNLKDRKNEILLRKMFSYTEYYGGGRYSKESGNAMIISESDLNTWEVIKGW